MGMPDVYRNNAAEFLRVVGTLSDAQLEQRVPACPDWTVHDLLAHEAGSSTDVVRGNVADAATDPWTDAQVAERRDRTVDELIAEWTANVDAVAAGCPRTGPSPAWDVTAHLDDLRETFGLPHAPPEQGWGAVLVDAVEIFASRAGTVSIAQCEPDPWDTTWHVTTAYGLWRGLFSRLDAEALDQEMVRGDARAFAASAFFAQGPPA